MRITSEQKSKYMRAGMIILSVVLLFSVALLGISIWERNQGNFDGKDDVDKSEDVEYHGDNYVLRDDLETVLIIGLDKFESEVDNSSFDNSQIGDFLTLLIIDKTNSSWSAIHINRDTMVDVDLLDISGQSMGTEKMQIALAHTEGNGKEVSCRNVADAVSRLLGGIKIDRYISVTMDVTTEYNDMVGGVTLEIMDDFTGVDSSMIKGETVTLNGTQALLYVRERFGLEDSSNLHRMERQRQYLSALYGKSLDCIKNDEEFIVKSTTKLFGYMVTNCTLNKLQSIASTISQYEYTKMYSMEGESKVGEEFMEFYPDKDALQDLLIEVFYKKKS